VIHTDFEKGFIRAETIAYDDYVALNGEARRARCRQAAGWKARSMSSADGDVMHFRFNYVTSCLSIVICEERNDEAIQLSCCSKGSWDCFASLAMTGKD